MSSPASESLSLLHPLTRGRAAVCLAALFAAQCVGCSPPSSAEKPARDTWDVITMKQDRVGYVHTTVEPAKYDGMPAQKITNEQHVAIQRYGQSTTQDVRVESFETPDGHQLAFRTEVRMAGTPQIIQGKVSDGKMAIEMTTQGKTERRSIPWPENYYGGYEPTMSLMRKPMQPGEKRELTAMDFLTAGPVVTRWTARDFEPVPMPTGTVDLLRIENETVYPSGQSLSTTMWCDRTGDCLVSQFEALGTTIRRATKEQALQKAEPAKLDLGWDIAVKVDKPIPNAHETKKITYRVHLEGLDPAAVFPSTASQRVRPLDAHTAEITVYAIRPGVAGNPDAPPDPPTAADRKPNNNIQSDDARVMARAQEAADDLTDPWAIAVALEKYVKKVVKFKGYATAFATAAEVAEKPEGDCSEHAVLLTALARARGLPARGVMGLLYMPQSKSFGYHMWSEVYVDNRWIPLDGTLGLGGIGAAHLELAHSDLEGASAFTSMIPVFKVLGALKIEVEQVEP